MIEMILVIFVVSNIVCLCVPLHKVEFVNSNLLINEIAICQYKAIIESETQYFDKYDMDIHFNRRGNVNMANSYDFSFGELIITLATGRVYVKE